METKSDSLKRVKRLWIFVLISGLLHLYIGFIYLTTDPIRFGFLSKIFILATVGNGLSEIIFFWIRDKKLYEPRLPASLYDIAVGASLYIYPFITIILFPFYIAGGLFIRGLTDLQSIRVGEEKRLLRSEFLKILAWIRIGLALLILVLITTGISELWFCALAFGIAGITLIMNAVKLKQIK